MRHPSVELYATDTPLHRLERLGGELGLGADRLWVKRDDCTGVAGGGNKARKLEYLLADAIAAGCDLVVTGGAAQSNHVRMTAAAARRCGLDCAAVLFGDPPSTAEGNLVLDDLLGVHLTWSGSGDYDETFEGVVQRASARGATAYRVPLGGSSPVGALGYVAAAREIAAAAPPDALVVTAASTGGTAAGLAAGLGEHRRVLAVDVGAFDDTAERIQTLAGEAASLAGLPAPTGTVALDRSQAGAGYGEPTDATHEALRMAAELEGLVLDPVYSGRALAGLIRACREGEVTTDHPVVFLHTGGLPALLTARYAGWFRPDR